MKKALRYLLSTAFLASVLVFTSCETTGFQEFGQILMESNDGTVVALGESFTSLGKAGEDICPKDAYEIGRAVAANINHTYPILRDYPETTEYLNKICKVITLNSPMPYMYNDYCVAIMDTDEINAMATPGGHIFISRGLLNCVDSEDAIAAIIAHEIAHIQLNHSIAVIRSNRISSATVKTAKASIFVVADVAMSSADIDKRTMRYELYSLGIDVDEIMKGVDELFDNTEQLFKSLIVSGFSKDQEFGADEEALYLMDKAGYDPYAMKDMLILVKNNQEKKHDSNGWEATHPSPKQRLKKVKKSLKKNHYLAWDMEPRRERFQENMKYLKY